MRRVNRSAIVPYSSEQMFALVADVESYPDFLPWCTGAQIHNIDGDVIEASVELSKSGLSKSFTTRNTLQRPDSISMTLVAGPFSHLDGGWQFLALGDDGCKVSMDLEFAFENRATDLLFGPVFEVVSNALIDAFTKRAAEIYDGND